MKKKTALIIGICGQDGSLLADLLLEKEYNVIGVMRRNATNNFGNVVHLENKIDIFEGDITDMSSMLRIVRDTRPHELYNMAAMSHVHTSFEQPLATLDIDTKGVVNILESIKLLGYSTRIFHASSIVFNTPVLIKYNGVLNRTTLENAFNLWKKGEHNSFEVLTADNDGKTCFKQVMDVVDHGFKQVYKISFSGGKDLIVTPDHSLITLYNNRFVETKVSDLSVGDHLITFCNQEDFYKHDKYKKLKWDFFLKHKVERNKGTKILNSKFNESILLNEEIAYLLGIYMAEGYYSKSHGNESITLTFSNHAFNCNRSEETKNIIEKYFKYKSNIRIKKNSTQVSICKRKICSFFSKYAENNSHSKRLPSELYESSTSVKISFLNGYLGGAKIDEREIKYTTIYKDLAIDILWLLRLIGIGGHLHNRFVKSFLLPQQILTKDSLVWDIIISKDELHNFSSYKIQKKDINIKNISGENLCHFENSDINMEKIQQIEKLHIHQRVGDFSVKDTEKWYCGVSPILVHNTSEMFGSSPAPQNTETIYMPQSPYAIAKVASHHFIRLYRESYNMYCCAGVTFNHEEPGRRGPNFVTRKISMGVAQALKNPSFKLKLGNLNARRDWGLAKEYCEGFIMTLQQPKPNDYIFATGETHSVKEFCEIAFGHVGLNWEDYVEIDRFYMRAAEVNDLCGDYSKTTELIGWEPKVKFEELVKRMVDYDCKLLGVNSKKEEDNET